MRARPRRLAVGIAAAILAAAASAGVAQSVRFGRSAANGKLAFVATRDGKWEVDVMDVDGTGQRRILGPSAYSADPAWSPDGSHIAYVCGNFSLCVANADGSGGKRLTDTGSWNGTWIFDESPTWSPDGTRLAFSSNRSGNYDIHVVGLDGAGLSRLGGTAEGDFAPAWSPDGGRVAFSSNGDVWVMGVDGTGPTNLTPAVGSEFGPTWSPDGRRIAFSRIVRADEDIGLVDVETRAIKAVTRGGGDEFDPTWSPDGTRIAFSTNAGGNWDVHVSNIAAGGRTRLTAAPAPEFSASWQPVPTDPRPAVPLSPGPPPPTPSGDARLVGNFLARYYGIRSTRQLLDEALEQVDFVAFVAAAERFRAGGRRASRTLAAEHPTSARGRSLQRSAVAAFRAFERAGTEFEAAIGSEDADVHFDAAEKALRDADNSLEAAFGTLG